MLNFIIFLFIFFFGILLNGVVTFLLFVKKKIKLKSDQIENQKEYFKILNIIKLKKNLQYIKMSLIINMQMMAMMPIKNK